MRMKNMLLLCIFLFLYSSASCFAQDMHSDTVNKIEKNLLELRMSNKQQLLNNQSLMIQLNNSEETVTDLWSIVDQQSNLLRQWENNWAETEKLLTKQSTSLKRWRRTCIVVTISVPVVAMTTAAVTMGVMNAH